MGWKDVGTEGLRRKSLYIIVLPGRSLIWGLFSIVLPCDYLLPDGFFSLEFWRHWFKWVIQWRFRIYFILKDHMISSSVLKPIRWLQEKQWRPLMSILAYMDRRQVSMRSVTTSRIAVCSVQNAKSTSFTLTLSPHYHLTSYHLMWYFQCEKKNAAL